MLKMYENRAHGGDSPDFWEENWEVGNFEAALRFCSVDPLRPLFEKYSEPGSLMLEGGCGLGQYLAYYSLKGRRVVGLDFAQRALKTLRGRVEGLDLCAGDVANLPFADETFDLYYSGGVVEHFEGGADVSLSEARRVLKKDGVLLMSVPYFSPLRRLLAPTKSAKWRIVDSPVVQSEPREGLNFFQYVYRPAEFIVMLERAGLEVVEKQGYAVLWGLADLPFVGGAGTENETTAASNGGDSMIDVGDFVRENDSQPRSLMKRLVVSEDAAVPVLGSGVRLMRWAASNMMMYVCRRAG